MIAAITKYRFFILALFSLVCAWVYWPGLYGPLLLDDESVFGAMLGASFGQSDFTRFFYSITGPLGRPVSMVTFVANALLSNDLFYWKLVNLILHITCGVLIYFVIARLLEIGGKVFEETPKMPLIPLCVSIVWMLHPLQVSTVLYTVQRMTQLSTLFVLAALLTYLIARQRQLNNQKFWLYQLATWCVLFPLAIFSKESALLFPVFVLLIEIFYIYSQKLSNSKVFTLISMLVVSGVAFCIFKADRILGGYARRDFSLSERLMTESRVLVDYLGMLLLPAQQRMGFLHDDYVISKGFFDPSTTLLSTLLIVFLISGAILIRKKMPLVSLGILFFFAGHLLESSIISLELVFEHRNYLPSLGILMAVAGLLSHVVENKKAVAGFFAVVLVAILFITFNRVQTWSSAMMMDYYIGMIHPKSERMASKSARKRAAYGKYDLARKRLEPFDSLGVKIHRLQIDCLEKKKLDDESLNIDMANYRVVDNYVVIGVTDIANAGLDDECDFSSEAFIRFLDMTLSKNVTPRSNRQIVMMYKAHYLWRLEHHQDAFNTLEAVYKLDRSNPTSLFLACEWMIDIDDHKQGRSVCNRALIVGAQDISRYGGLYEQVSTRLKSKEW